MFLEKKGKIKQMPSSSSTKVIIIVSPGSHFPQATVPIGRFILLGVGNPFSSSFPPPYCSDPFSHFFSARTSKESHISKGTLLLHFAYMHLLVSDVHARFLLAWWFTVFFFCLCGGLLVSLCVWRSSVVEMSVVVI